MMQLLGDLRLLRHPHRLAGRNPAHPQQVMARRRRGHDRAAGHRPGPGRSRHRARLRRPLLPGPHGLAPAGCTAGEPRRPDRDGARPVGLLPTWPPFEDVPDALGELRARGWRLAILSNTDPDLLAASLELIGVDVDIAITAKDARSHKPAPGHWERFAERVGNDRRHPVHVAASVFADLSPCADLGIPAVWINRLSSVTSTARAAELPDLRELPARLEELVPPDRQS